MAMTVVGCGSVSAMKCTPGVGRSGAADRLFELDGRQAVGLGERRAAERIEEVVAEEVPARATRKPRHRDHGARGAMLEAIATDRAERPHDAVDRDQVREDEHQRAGREDRAARAGPNPGD